MHHFSFSGEMARKVKVSIIMHEYHVSFYKTRLQLVSVWRSWHIFTPLKAIVSTPDQKAKE